MLTLTKEVDIYHQNTQYIKFYYALKLKINLNKAKNSLLTSKKNFQSSYFFGYITIIFK